MDDREELEVPMPVPPAFPIPTTQDHLIPEISMMPYDVGTDDNTTTTQPKATAEHRERLCYAPFPQFLRQFLQEAEPRSYALKEISKAYEDKTGRKPRGSSYMAWMLQ